MAVRLCATPKYTEAMWAGERTPICAYCSGEVAQHFGFREYPGEIGIFSCKEHFSLAKRDWHAELHNSKRLPVAVLLETFPEIKTENISIPRSDGSITAGGYIVSSDIDGDKSIQKTNTGKWTIPVYFTNEGELYCRDIFLDDLVHSGMLEVDVRRIISALDAGIFKTDYDAYMAARALATTLSEDTTTVAGGGASAVGSSI